MIPPTAAKLRIFSVPSLVVLYLLLIECLPQRGVVDAVSGSNSNGDGLTGLRKTRGYSPPSLNGESCMLIVPVLAGTVAPPLQYNTPWILCASPSSPRSSDLCAISSSVSLSYAQRLPRPKYKFLSVNTKEGSSVFGDRRSQSGVTFVER